MKNFEFEVMDNLGGNDGRAEGYFCISQNYSGAVHQTFMELDKLGIEAPCIPIILDEFGKGRHLNELLINFSSALSGFVTFGTDEYGYSTSMPRASHLSIILREVAQEQPGFVAPLLQVPDGKLNVDWKYKSGLEEIHHHFGSLTVTHNLCVLEVNDSIEPLPYDRIR